MDGKRTMAKKIAREAVKLNRLLFNGAIDLDAVTFKTARRFIGAKGIAGITYAFETDGERRRISTVYLFSKYCKGKLMRRRVLLHELVHVYQNQLRLPINHNGALMRYYCRKARSLGYEIDMKRF